jgi:hypothetical protein
VQLIAYVVIFTSDVLDRLCFRLLLEALLGWLARRARIRLGLFLDVRCAARFPAFARQKLVCVGFSVRVAVRTGKRIFVLPDRKGRFVASVDAVALSEEASREASMLVTAIMVWFHEEAHVEEPVRWHL